MTAVTNTTNFWGGFGGGLLSGMRDKSAVKTQHSKVRFRTWISNTGMSIQVIGLNCLPVRNEGLQLHSLSFRIFSDLNHSSKAQDTTTGLTHLEL
ncbi:MAG TPA: hypothetical protein DD979_11400 [Gammaproteobacteria bacterium]|jgi:hypothetical protein|nr:hypothetical protein [Gammaproteobacteria bacterium]